MQGNDSIKYATSILDYMFRELAVTYLDRFDLAHVDPSQAGFDALGKGVDEGKPRHAGDRDKFMSQGLTRSRNDRLVVMSGGTGAERGAGGSTDARAAGVPPPLGGEGQGGGRGGSTARSNVTPFGGARPRPPRCARSRWRNSPPRRRSKPCRGSKPTPAPTPPNSAPKPRPRATKARPAASAATSRWCATARA